MAESLGLRTAVAPETGEPWRPCNVYLATHPHSAWLDQKVAAILAHRTELERGALPGLVAGLAPDARARLLGTEWYIRWDMSPRG